MARALTVTAVVTGDHIDMFGLAAEQLGRGRWRVRTTGPRNCKECRENARLENPRMPPLHDHCDCVAYWESDDNEPDEDL